MWCCRRMEKITWNDHVKKEELQSVNVERNVLQTRKRRKANWIGYILRRNWLQNTLLKERRKDRSEGRRRKQLLEDIKEKEKAVN